MGRSLRRLAVVGVLALGTAACVGTVSDPTGDWNTDGGPVDVVEAGVDYQSATTKLWLRFAPNTEPASQQFWAISTDGDTTPELYAIIGYFVGGPSDDFFVGPGDTIFVNEPRCSGTVPQGGRVAPDRIELSFASSCLADVLPDALRISGGSHEYRYTSDSTGWTGVVLKS